MVVSDTMDGSNNHCRQELMKYCILSVYRISCEGCVSVQFNTSLNTIEQFTRHLSPFFGTPECYGHPVLRSFALSAVRVGTLEQAQTG
jgi:hypothetical protein